MVSVGSAPMTIEMPAGAAHHHHLHRVGIGGARESLWHPPSPAAQRRDRRPRCRCFVRTRSRASCSFSRPRLRATVRTLPRSELDAEMAEPADAVNRHKIPGSRALLRNA